MISAAARTRFGYWGHNVRLRTTVAAAPTPPVVTPLLPGRASAADGLLIGLLASDGLRTGLSGTDSALSGLTGRDSTRTGAAGNDSAVSGASGDDQ